jgi:sugar lactone lactonase YvrE
MQRIRAAIAISLLATGCSAQAEEPRAARQIFVVEGFDQPESVQYDERADVYYVSNMHGPGSVKDGVGYISWFSADDPQKRGYLAAGGQNGVTLDAPKGLALQGDTLWAADIDKLRGFHRRTGAPVAEIDLAPHGAVLLNSIAVGPDRMLYVSDTGIIMSPIGVLYPGGDKIFQVGPDGSVRVIAEGGDLGRPNGIRWDEEEGRLVVASFHPFESEVYTIQPGQPDRTVLSRGTGKFDGLAVLGDQRVLFTSWQDSSLYMMSGEGEPERIVENLWQPADLGIDTRRGRVAIPTALPSQVEIWELPPQ